MSNKDLVDQEVDLIEDITDAELQNDEELVEDVEVTDEETLAEEDTSVEDAVDEIVEDLEEYDFTEDLDALTAEEATLSEGFKDKAQIIFEAAIKSKMASEVDRLEESYAEKLAEETTTIKDELSTQIDGYLSYVVESWVEENKLAVEQGIRTEIAENFMTALQATFKEHYITVPEGKEDMFDEITTKAEDLEDQLAEAIEKNNSLKVDNMALQCSAKFTEISEGLTQTDIEKLRDLSKDIDFETVEQFEDKVSTIKDSYFKEAKLEVMQDVVVEEVETEEVEISDIMQRYVSAIKQTQN